jgi:hypothetical protein
MSQALVYKKYWTFYLPARVFLVYVAIHNFSREAIQIRYLLFYATNINVLPQNKMIDWRYNIDELHLYLIIKSYFPVPPNFNWLF